MLSDAPRILIRLIIIALLAFAAREAALRLNDLKHPPEEQEPTKLGRK